jgi:SAM-dependent methyltransferase
MPKDVWETGSAYEDYVGRWSRLIAREFLSWIRAPARASWLDIGCGTGALSQSVLASCDPARVVAVDFSRNFASHARRNTSDTRASFQVCDAQALCVRPATFDVAVSGLVLNFVPDPARMLSEAAAALRPGGVLSVYVWDYGGKMEMMRYFWDAAATVDPAGAGLDEARRFPMCRPEPLRALLSAARLAGVTVEPIDITTTFADFDDYWRPFLGGQGAAPAYAATLTEERRTELREHLRRTVPYQPDGSIRLIARAWAAKGHRPEE